MFRNGAVTVPNATIFLRSTVRVAWLCLLTLYFQEVLGYGPLTADLLLLPMALASVAAAMAGRLATNLGTGKTAALGLGGVVAGLLLVIGVSREGGLLVVLAGTVVGEAGFMFSNVTLNIAGTGATGRGRTGACGWPAQHLGPTRQCVGPRRGRHPGRRDGRPAGALAGGLGAGLLACTGPALLAMPIAFFGPPGEKFLQASDDGE